MFLIASNGDTATIEIQSNFFERRSPGDEAYINGKGKGVALVNYSTGIPFLYKTESEVVTTTSYYDIKDIQNFTLKLDSCIRIEAFETVIFSFSH